MRSYFCSTVSTIGSTRQRSLLPLLLLMLTHTLGCTTKAPEGSKVSERNSQDTPEVSAKWLIKDQQSVDDSIFVHLSKDATEIEAWENSEAWIQYYQGQLKVALNSFEVELSRKTSPHQNRLLIGQVRARLELASSYAHLAEISHYLTPLWLDYERDRPNIDVHKRWYNLIEWLNLQDQQLSDPIERERSKTLSRELATKDDTKTLLMWLSGQSEKPAPALKVRRSYKKWHQFALALKNGKLNEAQALYKKVKTDAHLLTSKGNDKIPSLKVYDPRAPKTLSHFYAQLVLQNCGDLTFGQYYCGRAYELLQQPLKAITAYNKAKTQLKGLITPPSPQGQPNQLWAHHLLLSSHLSLDSFSLELQARLKSLEASKAQTTTSIDQSTKVGNKSTVAELWSLYGLSADQQIPSLFPERRRPLSTLIAEALEKEKGEDLDYVASLSLTDRWLDELHYLYAVELIRRDKRVQALKTLNAAEEAKAGARLKGRNRLPRLFLSVLNQLKMGRYRVGAKYFQRLKGKLPALSSSLMMTSDILSGKSFEQNGSRANAGQ